MLGEVLGEDHRPVGAGDVVQVGGPDRQALVQEIRPPLPPERLVKVLVVVVYVIEHLVLHPGGRALEPPVVLGGDPGVRFVEEMEHVEELVGRRDLHGAVDLREARRALPVRRHEAQVVVHHDVGHPVGLGEGVGPRPDVLERLVGVRVPDVHRDQVRLDGRVGVAHLAHLGRIGRLEICGPALDHVGDVRVAELIADHGRGAVLVREVGTPLDGEVLGDETVGESGCARFPRGGAERRPAPCGGTAEELHGFGAKRGRKTPEPRPNVAQHRGAAPKREGLSFGGRGRGPRGPDSGRARPEPGRQPLGGPHRVEPVQFRLVGRGLPPGHQGVDPVGQIRHRRRTGPDRCDGEEDHQGPEKWFPHRFSFGNR